jgi:hypothetical protein
MNLLIISKGITCVEKPKQFHIDHIEVEERDRQKERITTSI